MEAVKTILDVAIEPNSHSSIDYGRWGGYYLKLNDKPNAIIKYLKAIELDPNDQQSKDALDSLTK